MQIIALQVHQELHACCFDFVGFHLRASELVAGWLSATLDSWLLLGHGIGLPMGDLLGNSYGDVNRLTAMGAYIRPFFDDLH